jgi:hypothetical protein
VTSQPSRLASGAVCADRQAARSRQGQIKIDRTRSQALLAQAAAHGDQLLHQGDGP